MCETGKIEYSSEREARAAVSAFKSRPRNLNTGKRRPNKRIPHTAYKCRFCGFYHLTSKKK